MSPAKKAKGKYRPRDRARKPHPMVAFPKGVVVDCAERLNLNWHWSLATADALASTKASPALAFIGQIDGEAFAFVAKCTCTDYAKCPRSRAVEAACDRFGSATVRELATVRMSKPR